MKKRLSYPVVFIVAVLMLSWLYTAFVFSKPERNGLFVFIMFIPAIIALVLNVVKYRSFKKVFSPLTAKVNLKSLLFAVFYPILFILIIAVFTWTLGLSEFNKETLLNAELNLGIVNIIVAFFLMFGEEYGWRGFLLKELADKRGKLYAIYIVGAVWALWHAPVVYNLAVAYNYSQPILLMIVQMMAVFVFSMPFAYSYFLSKSIVPPMIFHFVWNTFNPMVLGNIYSNNAGFMEGNILYINGEAISGIVLGLVFFVWLYRKYSVQNA